MDSEETRDSTKENKLKTETDNFNLETASFDLGPIKDEELIAEEKHIIDVIGNEEIDYGENNTSDVVSIVKKTTGNNSQSKDNLQASTVSACTLLNGVGLLTKPKAKTFKCGLCGFKTKIQLIIETHMLEHKNAIIKSQLEEYKKKKSHPNGKTLQATEKKKSKKQTFECIECGYKKCKAQECKRKIRMVKHKSAIINTQLEEYYKRKESYTYTSYGTILQEASKTLKTEIRHYFCDICGMLLTSRGSFNTHYDTHEKSVSYKHCDYNLKHTGKQIVVIENKRIDKDKKSQNDTVSVVEETTCKQLNYKNSCKSNLGKDNVCVNSPKSCQIKITETKPYCCDICGLLFTTTDFFLIHYNAHGKCVYCQLSDYKPKPEDKLFMCSNCNKRRNEETDNSSKKLETETYFCEICGLLYTKKRSFENHYSRKHSTKPFTCKICDYITNAEEKQGRCNKCDKRFRCLNCCTVHKSQCTRGRKYFCEICGLLFTTKTDFNAHYKTHTVEKPFACKVCDYITNPEEKRFSRRCGKCNKCFRCENCYTVHKRQCTRKRVKRQCLCEICGAKCSSPFFLNAHYRKHTGERPFPCEHCNFRAKTKSYLLKHMQTHTKEKNYKCEICSLSFTFAMSFNRHLEIHTSTKRFSCSVCKARFRQKVTLTQHLLVHTGEKPFKCNDCDYCCRNKAYLTAHMVRHTGVKLKRHGEKRFMCNVCNKTFMRKQTLSAHMPTHTGETPFKCNVCDYSCTSRARLTYHKVQHSGVKSFKCHFCDYSTAYYSRLYNHKRKHADPATVKKFECDKCDYRSTLKDNLKRHRRVHTGEKPYQCRICWAKFSQNSVLQGHMIKHTGEKPFHCNLCDYKCTKKQYLAKHQLKHF